MITKYQTRKSRQYECRSRPGVRVLFALTGQFQKLKVGPSLQKLGEQYSFEFENFLILV